MVRTEVPTLVCPCRFFRSEQYRTGKPIPGETMAAPIPLHTRWVYVEPQEESLRVLHLVPRVLRQHQAYLIWLLDHRPGC